MFGHQGASALWNCIFCEILKRNLGKQFASLSENDRKKRTLKSLKQCYDVYKQNFLNLPKSEQSKNKRASVTQQLSKSIISTPCLDVPLEVVTRASMHVILGCMRRILDWMLLLYRTLEDAAGKGQGSDNHKFRSSVQSAFENSTTYEEWLTSMLAETIAAIEGRTRAVEQTVERVSNILLGRVQSFTRLLLMLAMVQQKGSSIR